MLQLRGLTICREEKTSDSWLERFERLKQFEVGLNVLKDSCAFEIESLRHLINNLKKLIEFKVGIDYA